MAMTSDPLWPADFNLSPHHCRDVLDGCYDLPVEPEVILDIGANVGAFPRWAKGRWPGAKIYCYEPQPDNFTLLGKAIAHYGLSNIETRNIAIGGKDSRSILYENGFNCGEWSLIKFTEQGTGQISVPVVDAASLPWADFIKIDTEGMELEILTRLQNTGRLDHVKAIVLEYHSAVHVAVLIWLLQKSDLMLHSISPVSDHRGIMRFVRQ